MAAAGQGRPARARSAAGRPPVPAGFGVLRRYEQLLGLPPGRLTAIADWAYRKASALPGPPVLSRALDPADPRVYDRTEQLLEQALSAGLMAGRDWDELTACLAAFPNWPPRRRPRRCR
jgi:hypothetical protein